MNQDWISTNWYGPSQPIYITNIGWNCIFVFLSRFWNSFLLVKNWRGKEIKGDVGRVRRALISSFGLLLNGPVYQKTRSRKAIRVTNHKTYLGISRFKSLAPINDRAESGKNSKLSIPTQNCRVRVKITIEIEPLIFVKYPGIHPIEDFQISWKNNHFESWVLKWQFYECTKIIYRILGCIGCMAAYSTKIKGFIPIIAFVIFTFIRLENENLEIFRNSAL